MQNIRNNFKHPAPKSGRGFGFTTGDQYCKGICGRYKNNYKAGTKPYLTHVYCGRCNGGKRGVWMKRESMVNGKCPCCNFRPRQKNFKQ